MTAVDTNVVLRLLTGDHPLQSAAARALFASGPVWIARTVLLETSWVLRSVYGFEEQAIALALKRLLGLPNVRTEDEVAVASALSLTAQGIELADALHLTSSPPGAAFVSFDRPFVRRAKRAGVTAISTVPRQGT